MFVNLKDRRIGWAALMTIIVLSGALAQSNLVAADDPNPPRPAPPPPGGNMFRGDFSAPPDYQRALELMRQLQWAPGDETGKYWIGVECREAPPELLAQLGLKEGKGLVVIHLVEDGPGAKAGLKQHDLILSANDTSLNRAPDLVKAINGADGKEISLKVIRTGKEQTISVKPSERPQDNMRVFARPGPGMMFAGGGPALKIPDNMTISIVRQGSKPEKITITRGDDKWEVTDDELNKLPEDVRPIVQGAIDGGPMTIRLPGGVNFFGMQNDGRGNPGQNPLPHEFGRRGNDDGQNGPPPDNESRRGPPGSNAGPGASPDLMRRLDEIDRQLQRLQDELRAFRAMPNNSRDGGPSYGPPRVRPTGQPPQGDDGSQGSRRAGERNPPPDGGHGGPPPDGDRRGPPLNE